MADYQSLLEGESAANLQGTTEFEIITAIAYDYFASEQVDVAIMEVGDGWSSWIVPMFASLF